MNANTAPDAATGAAPEAALPPIVLIHGLWMTPKSWDTWAERFRARGHEVIVPGWPGVDDRTPAELRQDPRSLRGVGLKQVVDHYERIIRALPTKPIIMGHSFGGLVTQMLADRGLGVAVVGVAPGQPAGVKVLPFSTLRSGLPALYNPFAINGANAISKAHFRYTFGNDLSRAESDAIYEEQAIPSVNHVFFDGVLSLLNERGGVSKVDFAKADRAPLLVIGGAIDHVVPLTATRAIVKKYRQAGPAVVDYLEFEGRTHRLVSQDGWEEVADAALEWALVQAEVNA
ncbi:MAG: alpha/beta hydrolase [Microbacteriaceae bacterium]|nr:alpha/beta hydrolase [Microbacteriaceae bacterium]